MDRPRICKICGDTEFKEVGDLFQCRSCKHKTPKPKENAELLERANNLRFETKDFDGAAAIYEEIIRLTPNEAEAYWGRALCRFGIEYVKDKDGKYLPTCHRTIEGSILDDADYKMALSKAQKGMASYYTEQAEIIDKYQKKIKLIASKEEPYDVFISFKATDDNKKPTEDSLLAQELYYYLTKNLGLKVFFSNITLKDKAGQEFEPIIYAALSSATVMVLVATCVENVNATWVKNEWSRYIKMIPEAKAKGKSKYIVTALKGIKPEMLPSSLAIYQAVDLGEIGAKEKLCSNIDGLIGDLRVKADKTQTTGTGIDVSEMLQAEAQNLCTLGYQQLELGDFEKAETYFLKTLEKNPEYAAAAWGRILAIEKAKNDNELSNKDIPLKESALYKQAIEHATTEERMRFEVIAQLCQARYERADARTRHNSDYKMEVENLGDTYLHNLRGAELSIDEETDALFGQYRSNFNTQCDLSNEYKIIRGKTYIFGVFIMLAVVFGLILFSCTRATVINKGLDDTLEPYMGYRVFEERISKVRIPLKEILFGDVTPEDVGITTKEVEYLRNAPTLEEMRRAAKNEMNNQMMLMYVAMYLSLSVLIFYLLREFVGCLSIVIIMIVNLPLSVFIALLIYYYISTGRGFVPYALGYGVTALCVLAVLLQLYMLIRNSIRKGVIRFKYKKCGKAIDKIIDKLKAVSVKQVEEINNRYRKEYKGDITNFYVNEYVIRTAFEKFEHGDEEDNS